MKILIVTLALISTAVKASPFEEALSIALGHVGQAGTIKERIIKIRDLNFSEVSDGHQLQVIVEDQGLLDDSVRARRSILKLTKDENKNWTFIKEVLFDCYRSQKREFSKKPCP